MTGGWEEILPRLVHDAKALLRAPVIKTQLLRRKVGDSDPALAEALDSIAAGQKRVEEFLSRISMLREAMRVNPAGLERSVEASIMSARLSTKPMMDEVGGTWVVAHIEPCRTFMSLDKILIELIHNSVRFRREGIPVSIRIQALNGPGWIKLLYSDNSLGWDPAFTEKIMRPFETLDPERSGFGLGLPIAAAAAERGGGALHATSDETGSRFEIEVPAAA
jgi:signal transduction histidine kinase